MKGNNKNSVIEGTYHVHPVRLPLPAGVIELVRTDCYLRYCVAMIGTVADTISVT